jgi:DNA replication protein DnaC
MELAKKKIQEVLDRVTRREGNYLTNSGRKLPQINKCLICGKKTTKDVCVTEWQFLNEKMYERIVNSCSWECEAISLEMNIIDEAKRIYSRRLGNVSGIIPKKFQSIEFYDQEMVVKLSLEVKSLFITGGVGVGKTTLLSNILRKHLLQGRRAKFISYPIFIMEMQNAYRDKEKNPFDIAEMYAKYDGILAIDDLGAEKITDYVRQITYCIINQRELDLLPTIITSNYLLSQIDQQIDERISSRIAGMCEVIKLTGKDRRIK